MSRRKKRTSVHAVWVVSTGKGVAPSQKEGDISTNAAATPKGVDPSDWVMAEAETPSRPSSAAKVEQRDSLKKVDEEKQLLMNKLAELEVQHADLTQKVKGKSVYDELQGHRQPRNNAGNTCREHILQH